MKLRVSSGACPPLGPVVAVAFTDLAGAGLRALAALEPGENCSASALDVEVDGLVSAGAQPPARLVTFAGPDGSTRTSLLLLLARAAEEQHTSLAAAVHDFATQPGVDGVRLPPASLSARMTPPCLRRCKASGDYSRRHALPGAD